jgi:hypothetical protein
MTDKPETGADLDQLKAAVRDAVASGRDLQERVRDLTLTAFKSAGVDLSSVEKVTRAALEGVDAGAGKSDAARQAVAGIEDALKQAAEASSLAIREAAGHASEFAQTDLRRAVDELASLEKLFIDTLGDVARAGSTTAKAAFDDIQRHMLHSGTAFGEQLTTHVGALQRLLAQTGQENLQAGAEAAGQTLERLGKLAGSLLAGFDAGLRGGGTSSVKDKDDRGEGDA